MAIWLFWLSFVSVVYTYVGYPAVLIAFARLRPRDVDARACDEQHLPSVTMIVPVHNECGVIERKVRNTSTLDYPSGRLQVLFVSDGSTDGTAEVIQNARDPRVRLLELPVRQGKAAALNVGLSHAAHEIVVFTDASILLERGAVLEIVRPFQQSDVGCVSGEDLVAATGGEGLYGRYELALRRLESRLHSIVGASGSFYAQRRELCEPFVPNLAPDFLSVLRTVQRGSRAISWPGARGSMTAVEKVGDEFERKVRTVLRGLTTLRQHTALLNPLRYGVFAFELLSHKLARWLVPFFLMSLFASSFVLAQSSPFYLVAFCLQAVFYAMAAITIARAPRPPSSMPAKVSVYFTTVNLATLSAWCKYALGVRLELWTPSRR